MIRREGGIMGKLVPDERGIQEWVDTHYTKDEGGKLPNRTPSNDPLGKILTRHGRQMTIPRIVWEPSEK
jgi:hypothetical protein